MYIHKKTGAKITDQQYLYDLDSFEQMEYIRSVESESKKNSSGDVLTSGIIGAVTDNALLGGLLGGSIIGGVIGDVFGDGELF